jgi:PleD family two-component response regulator
MAYLMKPVLKNGAAGGGAHSAPPVPASEAIPEMRSQTILASNREMRCAFLDNSVNQVLAVRPLKRQGCTVTLARNGHEVLRELSKANFDAIFIDGQMPSMTGFEATQAISEERKRLRQSHSDDCHDCARG